jgi:glycosyltransferase involved in cell wall biosynthesis
MRILFISYRFYPYVGGIEVNSEILASYFTSFGAEVRLLTTTVSDKERDVENFNFEVFRNPGFKERCQLFKWADIIYENNPSLSLSWMSIFSKVKRVVALRTWVARMDGSLAWQDKLKLWWIKMADAVIAVSEEVRRQTFKEAIVIGNPYRNELFIMNPTFERDSNSFVFLGRLVSDKGADMAIQLVANLLAEFRGEVFSLIIIGNGEEEARLKKMVTELKLQQYITFTGILRGEALVKMLNKCKYILIPSKWREPFGNIALEGMACGCLPIVSDGGGLVDAVGNAGIVFQRNNIKDLTDKIIYLLKNSNLEASLRSNFSNHLEKHKPDIVSEKYFEVLKNVYNE